MSADNMQTNLRQLFTWPDRVLNDDWSSVIEGAPAEDALRDLVARYVKLRRKAPNWSPTKLDRNNHQGIPNDDLVLLLLDAKKADRANDKTRSPERSRPVRQGRRRVCFVCGGSFRAQRRTARYCSESCKQKAKRDRESAAVGPESDVQDWGGLHPHDTLKVEDGLSGSGAA